MKLSAYLPEIPATIALGQKMNNIINTLELSKSSAGTTYRPASFGLDSIVSTWIRQSQSYRYQMVMDLQTIAHTVEEIRSPITQIVSEVFRRGIQWKPKFAVKCEKCGIEYPDKVEECEKCKSKENLTLPDETQKTRLTNFMDDANLFDKSMEETLRTLLFDVNSVDDGFLYIVKEYHGDDDIEKPVRSRVVELRRLHPALIEFDLDSQGLPKNSHWVCYLHRDDSPAAEPGYCPECGRGLVPAMYIYWHRSQAAKKYLLDSEIVHISKFSHSETYGFSPIMTVFEQALTLIGMSRNLYSYFWERRMPACFDVKTEVLTHSGWKFFQDIDHTDEFATLSKDGIFEYQKPLGVVKEHYSGPMYQLKNNHLDLLVTPNHNLYAKETENGHFNLIQAKDLFGKRYEMWRGSGAWQGQRKNSFVLPGMSFDRWKTSDIVIETSAENWAKFLGVLYATGYIGRREIGLSLYSNKNLIFEILEKMHGISFKINASGRSVVNFSGILANYFKENYGNSQLILSAMEKMSLECRNSFSSTAKSIFASQAPCFQGRHKKKIQLLDSLNLNGSIQQNINDSKDLTITIKHKSTRQDHGDLSDVQIDMDDWLKFLGIYLAEGFSSGSQGGKSGSHSVGISQYGSDNLKIIQDWVSKLPFEWKEIHSNEKLVGLYCTDRRLFNYMKQFGNAQHKFLPREYLDLPSEQLEILFNAWMLGDAGATISQDLLNNMMEAALKIGWGASYSYKDYIAPRGGKKGGSAEERTIYQLHVYKKDKEKSQTITVNNSQQQDSWVPYNDMVYCVEVPNHTLFVRRNGKYVLSGQSMIMVFTDDPDSLRRERENITSQMRLDPNYVPMIAVSAKQGRGRVDMVRLMHTLQEMDYLPVRQEIRERIAAMWGVTPIWQGAPDAMGGLAQQTSQLTVMSRVVEGDQRIFHEKVFPQILDAFGITDWKLELPLPEEEAEQTRIAFAQQKMQVASMAQQMGFDVKIKSQDVGIDEIDFVISGEATKPQSMGFGGGQGGGMMPQQMGGGQGQEPPMGAPQPGDGNPVEGQGQNQALNLMMKNWDGIRLNSDGGWIGQLMDKGYVPIIKQINPDGTTWFVSGGQDLIARFSNGILMNVEKAVFKSIIPQYKRKTAKSPNIIPVSDTDFEEGGI